MHLLVHELYRPSFLLFRCWSHLELAGVIYRHSLQDTCCDVHGYVNFSSRIYVRRLIFIVM